MIRNDCTDCLARFPDVASSLPRLVRFPNSPSTALFSLLIIINSIVLHMTRVCTHVPVHHIPHVQHNCVIEFILNNYEKKKQFIVELCVVVEVCDHCITHFYCPIYYYNNAYTHYCTTCYIVVITIIIIIIIIVIIIVVLRRHFCVFLITY